jgi:hypothetical protein
MPPKKIFWARIARRDCPTNPAGANEFILVNWRLMSKHLAGTRASR